MAKIQTIRVRYDINTDAVEATAKAWDDVEQSVEGTEQASKDLRKEFTKQVKSVDDLRKKEKQLKAERDKSNDPKKIQQLNQQIKGTQSEMSKVTGETKKSGNAMESLVGAIGGAVAIAGVAELGRQAIQSAIEFEQLQISFETFLGSAEKANEVIAGLEGFAGATPFTTEEVLNAGRSLLAFGESADTVESTLRQLGDISAGTGKDFGELATLFGKARVSGVLMSEDINQFTEAGIPIIDEFAKILGVSASEVKKLGSDGQISFATLQEAIGNMTSEGGKFAGLTERLSQSTGGLLSTLQSNMQILLRDLGTAVLPVVADIVKGIGEFVDFMKDLFSPVVDAFSSIGESLGRLGALFGSTGSKASKFGSIIKLISLPFTVVHRVLGAITQGLAWLTEKITDFIEQSPFLTKAVETIGVAFRAVGDAMDAVSNFFDQLLSTSQDFDSTFTTLNKRLENLGVSFSQILGPATKIFKEELGATQAELTSFTNQFDLGLLKNAKSVSEASGIVTKEFMKWRESQNAVGESATKTGKDVQTFADGSIAKLQQEIAKLNKEYNETGDAIRRAQITDEIKELNDQVAILKGEFAPATRQMFTTAEAMEKLSESIQTGIGNEDVSFRLANINEELERTTKEAEKARQELEAMLKKENLEEFQEGFQAVAGGLMQISGEVGNLLNAQADAELKRLEERQQREIELAGDSAEARAIIERKFDKEREAIQRENAIRQKALAIFETIINTASAIVANLENPALATLAGVVGALQLATIQATPIPFAEGGFVTGGEPNKDSVSAMLMPGEFVVTKKRYKEYKPIIDAIHAGTFPNWLGNFGGSGMSDKNIIKALGNETRESKKIARGIKTSNKLLHAMLENSDSYRRYSPRRGY